MHSCPWRHVGLYATVRSFLCLRSFVHGTGNEFGAGGEQMRRIC
uniref:Uncharacterized protein n=1 Tax=Arundo donax TaxID=35708 RepID=A0A0A9BKY0_ARUDO